MSGRRGINRGDSESLLGNPNGKPGPGYSGSVVGLLSVLAIGFLGWAIATTVVMTQRVDPRCTTMCGDILIYCDEFCVTDLIVGGGTTGLSIANKLSQNTTRNVLVLEAGADPVNSLNANDMGNGLRMESLFQTDPNHYYFMTTTTVQQATIQSFVLQGRILGGSSSINDAEMVKGTIGYWNALDTFMGGTGKFAGDNVYEVFRRVEYLNPSPVYTPDATNGLTPNVWKVAVYPKVLNTADDTHVIANMLAGSLGIPNQGPLLNGVNDPDVTIGAFPSADWLYDFQATANPIIRWSSRKAFLNATVMDQTLYFGPRIRVSISSTVQKLLFHPLDPTKAIGVEYLDANRVTRRAFATENVVLSTWNYDAGLLQQAGIGPAATLSAAGITPRIVNENVGRHWKNHPTISMAFLFPNMTGVANPQDVPMISGFAGHFVEDAVLGTPGQRGYQFISISFPSVFAMFDLQLRSQSEGTIDIYSDDPQQRPKMNPNFFGNTTDLLSWRTHLRTLITSMQAYDTNIVPLSISNATLFDDNLLNQWLIDNLLPIASMNHNYGSARLGTSAATAVVDSDFKVFGAKNLRVCDCNIFPEQTDGNPSYPAVAIGQICALSIMGLPTPIPPAKKRSTPTKKSTFSTPLPPKRDHVPTKRSLTDRQMYDAIVNYFNQIRTMYPAEADKMITSIQNNQPWISLQSQFGPYVPPSS
jgi:choline dehydrogenase